MKWEDWEKALTLGAILRPGQMIDVDALQKRNQKILDEAMAIANKTDAEYKAEAKERTDEMMREIYLEAGYDIRPGETAAEFEERKRQRDAWVDEKRKIADARYESGVAEANSEYEDRCKALADEYEQKKREALEEHNRRGVDILRSGAGGLDKEAEAYARTLRLMESDYARSLKRLEYDRDSRIRRSNSEKLKYMNDVNRGWDPDAQEWRFDLFPTPTL